MKIVGLLQCQWFKDPDRMAKEYQKWARMYPDDYRERWVRTWLFWSCQTGQRLKKHFGEQQCEEIIWDNTSPKFGGKASDCFDVDLVHMQWILDFYKPDVLLLFGKVAQNAVDMLLRVEYKGLLTVKTVIEGPHPAARGTTVPNELARMARELKCLKSS